MVPVAELEFEGNDASDRLLVVVTELQLSVMIHNSSKLSLLLYLS